MVVAQPATASGQDVLVECAGLLMRMSALQVLGVHVSSGLLSARTSAARHDGGKVGGRGDSFGMVVAQHPAPRAKVSSLSARAC